MPIRGLTDRNEAAFPRIGFLRKGAPKPEKGNKPGPDLDHFRFDSDNQQAVKRFAEAYGSEPAAINVYLPFADVDRNFQAWQEQWVAGGLVHRCDGETCVIWRTEAGTYSHAPKPCPGGCSEVGRLSVIVPELQRLAYVTVLTSSINDIMELQANLEAAYALRGDLRGIPFVLRRTPRMISTPGPDGKRVRREKWLLSIEPAPEWVSLQIQQMHLNALPGNEEHRLMIAGPDIAVNVDTGEVIDGDYTEPPQQPPQPINGNGSKPKRDPNARPWPSEDVIEALHERASYHVGNGSKLENGNAGRWGALAGWFGDNAAPFLTAVFGVASRGDLSDDQKLALVEWSKIEKHDGDGQWYPCDAAVSEFQQVVKWAELEAGQTELPLE